MIRNILALLFLSLVPLAVHAATLGLIGGDVGNVAIYGDSMSNDFNPGSCEWCDPLDAAGINVWGMARAGARTYDDDTVDPAACQSPTYDGCEFYGERMTAYLDGACRRNLGQAIYPGDVTQTTCIADLPNSPQTVDVFFFGANDIRGNTFASWLTDDRADSLAAWDVMLDASDLLGHANVVVLGPPYLQYAGVGADESDAALVDLHDALRLKCASRPRCEIADVYSSFRAVEAADGLDALHAMYAGFDDCPNTVCIHPADGPTPAGYYPNNMAGEIILQAIRRANAKRVGTP